MTLPPTRAGSTSESMPTPPNLPSRASAAGGNGSATRAIPRLNASPITADCCGRNGARVRLWKRELQRFADETGLFVTVAHLPPGTSKWNRIEHRLFAYISQNWRGKPLVSHQVIIQLIGATTTNTGLTVTCDIDHSLYPKGIKVTDAEMTTLNIQRHTFQGDWNYTISPRQHGPP